MLSPSVADSLRCMPAACPAWLPSPCSWAFQEPTSGRQVRMSTVIKHKLQRKCPRPGAPPRRPGRRHRPERALPPAGAARPRCPPSEEQRHHSVEASVRTSGRQSCVASASKTQICRTARRPRGARAASRARCAGRARDMFFVRPNATGHDLPSPRLRSRREAGRDKPWPGTSSSSLSWIRRASHAARAATAQPAHPDRARIAHAAHICCVQVLLARTHQCQQCPPPRGRARSTGRRGAAAVCPRLA